MCPVVNVWPSLRPARRRQECVCWRCTEWQGCWRRSCPTEQPPPEVWAALPHTLSSHKTRMSTIWRIIENSVCMQSKQTFFLPSHICCQIDFFSPITVAIDFYQSVLLQVRRIQVNHIWLLRQNVISGSNPNQTKSHRFTVSVQCSFKNYHLQCVTVVLLLLLN